MEIPVDRTNLKPGLLETLERLELLDESLGDVDDGLLPLDDVEL